MLTKAKKTSGCSLLLVVVSLRDSQACRAGRMRVRVSERTQRRRESDASSLSFSQRNRRTRRDELSRRPSLCLSPFFAERDGGSTCRLNLLSGRRTLTGNQLSGVLWRLSEPTREWGVDAFSLSLSHFLCSLSAAFVLCSFPLPLLLSCSSSPEPWRITS